MALDELIEVANGMMTNGWRFEWYADNKGWFYNPSSDNDFFRRAHGPALPFYEALKSVFVRFDYFGSCPIA